MNLTDYIKTSDKFKLTKPQLNLVTKLESMGVTVDPLEDCVTNPHTCQAGSVDPLIAVLIKWVYSVYATYRNGKMSYRGIKVTVDNFDRVRMLILSLDKTAYRNFID